MNEFSNTGSGKPLNVLIVGGGTAGWMTAAALSRHVPREQARITLIESSQIGTVGVGEATVPHIRYFNSSIGLNEAELMSATQATFKLGIEFCNWGQIGDSYIHPFGEFGEPLGGIAFHHHWLRARQSGRADDLQAYSLPIMAARQNRFDHPSSDPQSPNSTYSYAYQFDAGLYAGCLRKISEARGVTRIDARIASCQRDTNSGHINSVVLESGEEIQADLFVDCSGFRGLLIDQGPQNPFEDWSAWLPCDRAWAVPCETVGELTPYTRATAQQAGWTWRIPLQHRVGNGHVFSSAHCSDEEALQLLLSALEGPAVGEPRLLKFKAGKRRTQWSGNVVSIGLSSGFLEPLESTSIHLIQLAIGYLVELFPNRGLDPVKTGEFNRIMALEYERIRDFLILHYHATQRSDSPFWNDCRKLEIPDSLAYRMDLFKRRGLVPNYREGMFLDASWLAVYAGQNVIPQNFDPACETLTHGELIERLSALQARQREALQAMPAHGDRLQQIGALNGVNGQ